MEVSHVKIGLQELKLWNLEVQFWVPILTSTGITEKSNMKIVSNFDPRQKENFQCSILENLTTNS